MKNAPSSATKVRTAPSVSSSHASADVTASLQAQANAQALASVQAKSSPAPVNAAVQVSSPPSPVAVPSALPPARLASGDRAMGAEELAIADRVHQGHLACELGATVRLDADPSQPGYFNVRGKGFRYRMHPVATSTGAIRLEDKKAGAVWLQLANKSMLMDQNKGRRIADECAHPEQVVFAQDMKHNPPPKLFDTTGMGR
ncbi:hypothetical protein B9Z51_03140 [Limnohabitans sp. T6-5]|nr:hypothetical protein B9Z51_03140 [Limnohabitans sp. T6-5]